jgi:hypothetical protein
METQTQFKFGLTPVPTTGADHSGAPANIHHWYDGREEWPDAILTLFSR